MSEFENVGIDGLAPFQNQAAFNTYWTYNPSTKEAFWAQLSSRYQYFGMRYLQQWLYWYDGWVPYFHNENNGIFSTKLAQSLTNRIAQKVYGGRLMFKNLGNEKCGHEPNEALQKVSDWAADNYSAAVYRAILYAAVGGTSLIKANCDSKGLWTEALRIDSFIPSFDFRGQLAKVTCYLSQSGDVKKNDDGKAVQNYYLVEERYFGDYEVPPFGTKKKNVPLVKYSVKYATGIIGTGGDFTNSNCQEVPFKRLPKKVRTDILKNYGALEFDTPKMLPFDGWLGCEIVKWTENVSDLPQLPFGESLIAPIISQLMVYDYYFSAFATDMYTGRAKVLMPGYMIDNAKATAHQNYNSNFDSFLYKKYPSKNPEAEKPIPLQFDLRSQEWATIRNSLLENIAVSLGINTSTIAGFLGDNNARTAREVSTEENETAGYINSKRAIIERPLNRFLEKVCKYMGLVDRVGVRWSGAGLTNMQSLSEILATGLSSGFISRRKAVQMFNYDDDDAQVEEEYQRAQAETDKRESNQYAGFGAFGGDEALPE